MPGQPPALCPLSYLLGTDLTQPVLLPRGERVQSGGTSLLLVRGDKEPFKTHRHVAISRWLGGGTGMPLGVGEPACEHEASGGSHCFPLVS